MATQVYTASETRYIVNIAAVDEATDQITISTVAPGSPPAGPTVAGVYSFPVTKPHSYVTGDALAFTRTVETTS